MLDLVVFFVRLFSEETGFLQLVLQGVHALFIGEWTVLEYLTGTDKKKKTSLYMTTKIKTVKLDTRLNPGITAPIEREMSHILHP